MIFRFSRHIGFVIVLFIFLGCSSKHKIIGTEFKNGDITFSANIYKPEGNGLFPAVIMVHGSKNHTKDFYTEYSGYFADNGIVALNYDNRGHGNSNGNLWTSTFNDLATDLTAAVEYLRTLDYVDKDKIGFWTDSHGGWIVLIADSISENIDFLKNTFYAKEINRSLMPNCEIANVILQIRDSCFLVSQAREEFTGMKTPPYLYVDDVELIHKRAVGFGAKVSFEPDDMPYEDRNTTFTFRERQLLPCDRKG